MHKAGAGFPRLSHNKRSRLSAGSELWELSVAAECKTERRVSGKPRAADATEQVLSSHLRATSGAPWGRAPESLHLVFLLSPSVGGRLGSPRRGAQIDTLLKQPSF